jgi:hypothetical protein
VAITWVPVLLKAHQVLTKTQFTGRAKYPGSLNSYYGRISYNIDEKYLFTATGRYDGSSRPADKNKFAFFPSVGAAWRVSQEDFLKDNKPYLT